MTKKYYVYTIKLRLRHSNVQILCFTVIQSHVVQLYVRELLEPLRFATVQRLPPNTTAGPLKRFPLQRRFSPLRRITVGSPRMSSRYVKLKSPVEGSFSVFQDVIYHSVFVFRFHPSFIPGSSVLPG
nr:hypothetical protein Iba_chr14eCG3140 [Ipomoea batatas]